MTVHADCFVATGVTHAICQDYALAVPARGAVVVSDGCSSSPATDFGARFLALAAARLPGLDAAEAGAAIVEAAGAMAGAAGLPARCLDATLLAASCRGDEIRVVAWGDGVIAARRRDGGALEHVVIECPRGAPDYLSYLLDAERRAAYLEEMGAGKQIRSFVDGHPESVEPLACFVPLTRRFALARYDLVALCSDGVRTFQRPGGTALQNVPEHEVLQHVMAIRSATGAFVVRRVRNGFLGRHCAATGWRHADDFAVGALCGDAS